MQNEGQQGKVNKYKTNEHFFRGPNKVSVLGLKISNLMMFITNA